jgi:hypothetical protein
MTVTNSIARENTHSVRLVRDIFAAAGDEPDADVLDAQLLMAVDAALPDEEAKARFPQLWQHFRLYPSAEQEYRLLLELVAAEASATLQQPTVLPLLPTLPAMPVALRQLVQQMADQGKRWVQDAAGELYIWLASATQPVANPGWVTRSDQPGVLLFQETLNGLQGAESWEIVVSVSMETEQRCRITVSLYDLNNPDADLGNVLVALQSDTVIASTTTTVDGQATFSGINKAALARLVVRVDTGAYVRGVA